MATVYTQVPQSNKIGPTKQRMGVTGQGLLQPKLKYRFRVIFENLAKGSKPIFLTQQVVSCTRPKTTFGEQPLHSYNNIVYIPNKPEWQTISLVLRDDITNTVSSLVSSQTQQQMNFYTMSAFVAGDNFKFTMRIQTLDGTMTANPTDTGDYSNVLEDWVLEGCYITDTDNGDLDYSSADPLTQTLTIRYDNATHGSENGGGTIDSFVYGSTNILA
jgi:hypothetical protein